MTVLFDHTIVPSRNKIESASFYSKILRFDDLGELPGGLHALQINSSTVLFLENSKGTDSSPWSQGVHHYAFHLDKKTFDQVFSRLKRDGIPYGESYSKPDNMKGPGTAPGAKGKGKSIYFKDPSDNLLQIIRY